MTRFNIAPNFFSTSFLALILTGCGGGGSEDSSQVSQPILNAPQNVQAVAHDGEISITWSSDNTADSYDVYVASDLELNFENYSVYENSTRLLDVSSPISFTPSDLSPLYRVIVVAKQGAREAEHTDLVTVAPRYTDQGDTVLDLVTSVVWMKCAIGQVFDDSQNTCLNDPARLTRRETESYINAYAPEFRLPTESELITLVHCKSAKPKFFLTDTDEQCESIDQGASIYTPIFSGTIYYSPIDGYRTSTVYDNFDGIITYTRVSFGPEGGKSGIQASDPVPMNVRLVKR